MMPALLMPRAARSCRRGMLALLCWLLPLVALADGPDVPRTKFHIFVLAGQSNMAGRGRITAADKRPHPRIWMLDKTLKWVPAVAPLHFDKPVAGVGLGRSFALALVERDPEVVVGLVPCAVGGSPIDSWQPGGYHVQTRTHPWDDAVPRMAAAARLGTIKAVLWHQGESDSRPELAKDYAGKLRQVVTRFRETLESPQLPFLIGQMGRFEDRPWDESRRIVDAAHRRLGVAGTAFVSSQGLRHKGDKVHFDAASYRELGRRYALMYLQLVE